MAGVVGFEPTDAGVKVPCLNRLGYTPTISLVKKRSFRCGKSKNGSSDGTRTCDILINSQTLYQLSYRGICCGNYLLSHVVSNEVPLAFGRLTTVFGMGTGGTVRASSPHLLECYSLKTRQKKLFCKLVAKYQTSQALDRLVLVSCMRYRTSTPSLSTSSSARGLTLL